ncbi:MAG: VWA domain-containing protein [Solobacterium sp.]|nr:VWA domain-containing protein [Solobacterium sp.]
MKKGLTELVFLLDRSGSMAGLEKDTIGGYNAMIQEQREQEGEVLVSTVLFDHETTVITDRMPMDRVKLLDEKTYRVRGSTALLDAIGGSITHIGNVHKYARTEDVPEKTLFMITTDGMENSSRIYTYRRVKEMVERQREKYHWEFLFLGANMDAIQEAARFGISGKGRAVSYECDEEGTALNYRVMSTIVSAARRSESREKLEEILDEADLVSPITAHYRKSHRK